MHDDGQWVYAAAAEMRPYVEKMPETVPAPDPAGASRAHLLYMIEQISGFSDLYKAHRWLGWLQKAACDAGVITLDQCRELARRHVNEVNSGS